MHPILLRLGPLTIHSFGFMLFAAAITASFLVWKQARQKGLPEEKILDIFLLAFFLALIGARLGFVAGNASTFAVDYSRILLFARYPGLSFPWGLVSGVVGVATAAAAFGLTPLLVLDIFAVAGSLAVTFGLGGCFLDGCLAVAPAAYLIMILANLVMAVFLGKVAGQLFASASLSNLAKRPGLIFSTYLIFLSLSLLIISSVRGEEKAVYVFILGISLVFFMIRFPSNVLAQIKQYLEEKHRQTERSLKELKKEDPFEDKSRLLDRASDDTEAQSKAGHERVAAVQQQLNMILVQTRKALTKIKIGKYGICESCGKMIDTDRLAVVPAAVLCLACEKKREKR